jgi:hypothetical protein
MPATLLWSTRSFLALNVADLPHLWARFDLPKDDVQRLRPPRRSPADRGVSRRGDRGVFLERGPGGRERARGLAHAPLAQDLRDRRRRARPSHAEAYGSRARVATAFWLAPARRGPRSSRSGSAAEAVRVPARGERAEHRGSSSALGRRECGRLRRGSERGPPSQGSDRGVDTATCATGLRAARARAPARSLRPGRNDPRARRHVDAGSARPAQRTTLDRVVPAPVSINALCPN